MKLSWASFKYRKHAHAVNRRLSTVADQVRALVRSCGICGGQTGSGAGFLWVLQFPLPLIIIIIRGWYKRTKGDQCGKWIQSPPTTRKKKSLSFFTYHFYYLFHALTFADRGCYVVSVMDAYGRILGFPDQSSTFFLSCSSSVALTRLSGPSSGPTTVHKIW
jgi:hypothetical protein